MSRAKPIPLTLARQELRDLMWQNRVVAVVAEPLHPGDRVWIREPWAHLEPHQDSYLGRAGGRRVAFSHTHQVYVADGPGPLSGVDSWRSWEWEAMTWKPAEEMAERDCRLRATVTGVDDLGDGKFAVRLRKEVADVDAILAGFGG